MVALQMLGIGEPSARRMRTSVSDAVFMAALPHRPDVAEFLRLADGRLNAGTMGPTVTVRAFLENLQKGLYDD
jgi:hypothetical protein